MCDMTHPYVWRTPFARVTWHDSPIDLLLVMTHPLSYVWHDPFECVVWHASSICVTYRALLRRYRALLQQYWAHLQRCWALLQRYSHVWHDSPVALLRAITHSHSYVWHDSFECVPCLISSLCVCVWRNSFACGTRLARRCPPCHDTFACANVSLQGGVVWRIHTRDMTLSHVWLNSSICVTWLIRMVCGLGSSVVVTDRGQPQAGPAMGGLRLVGSLKITGLSCKRAL